MLTMKYRAIYFFFKTLAYAWLFYQIWLLFGIIDGVCPCAKSTEQTIKVTQFKIKILLCMCCVYGIYEKKPIWILMLVIYEIVILHSPIIALFSINVRPLFIITVLDRISNQQRYFGGLLTFIEEHCLLYFTIKAVRLFLTINLYLFYKLIKEENRRHSSALCEPTTIKYDHFENEQIHCTTVNLDDRVETNYDKMNKINLTEHVEVESAARIKTIIDGLWSFVVLFVVVFTAIIIASYLLEYTNFFFSWFDLKPLEKLQLDVNKM